MNAKDSDLKKRLANYVVPVGTIALQAIAIVFLNTPGSMKYSITLVIVTLCIIVGVNRIRINRKSTPQNQILLLFLPFLFLAIQGIVVAIAKHPEFVNEAAKQAMMYVFPFFLSGALMAFSKRDCQTINVQFAVLALLFIFSSARNVYGGEPLESTMAFSFGLFTLYYLYKRHLSLSAFSFILLFIADKRIATFACVLAIGVFLITRYKRKNGKILALIYICFLACIFLYNYLISTGQLDLLFSSYGINSMGRIGLYSLFADDIHAFFSVSASSFGQGSGYVLSTMSLLNAPAGNLHNDWLGIMIEYGRIGTLVFVALNAFFVFSTVKNQDGKWSAPRTAAIVCIFVYWQTVWLTDNVTIYILNLFSFYSIMITLIRSQNVEYIDFCTKEMQAVEACRTDQRKGLKYGAN